ncbi:unnamed protein product [Spirodela intermedia]|uniref:Pentatricopeptide repeat-containing protein n=1 Tax=Spirodela intermedia TaxID=51605 RepID=A0ABN7EDD1_SPIIN|nr:unnamed protein product [Spirodela intermedia]
MGAASVPRFNRLIGRYGNEGRLWRNVYTWNAMICGYARTGTSPARGPSSMPRPNGTPSRRGWGTSPSPAAPRRRRQAGADADGYGAAALIDAYSKCVGRFEEALLQAAPGGGEAAAAKNAALAALCRQGEMEAAFELFFSGGGHAASPPVEIVAWNTLIAGCVKNGLPKLALHLFDEMSQGGIPWNEHTLVSILRACSALRSLSQGKQAHAWAIKKEDLGRNPHVGAAVVDFYRHCGELSSAEAVHSASCRRNPFATASMNPAALTALLSAYFRRGLFDQVGELLRDACSSSSTLDESLFVNLLAACADQAELGRGKELHGRMVRAGFCPAEGRAGGALVDMYAKCGEIGGAARVFKRVPHKDLVHCNTMLAGLARHGRALEALQLFKAITAELRPDGATFTAVLSACGHAGLMAEVHGVSPELGHYCCMVDLYGRAGRVKEALEMVGRLPFRPDAVLWGALLDACRRRHGGAAGARRLVRSSSRRRAAATERGTCRWPTHSPRRANGLSGAP